MCGRHVVPMIVLDVLWWSKTTATLIDSGVILHLLLVTLIQIIIERAFCIALLFPQGQIHGLQGLLKVAADNRASYSHFLPVAFLATR